MDGIVPESSINNINQRNEETSDEKEDDCFENGNNDDEATMYKSRDGTMWSEISSNSSQGRDALKTLFARRMVQQDLFAILLILQQMFLKNFWV